MQFESDFSREASSRRPDRLLSMSYRKAAKYYWIFIGAIAIVLLIFILASNILKRPSAIRIMISVAIVILYICLSYFCRPKHPARDESDYLLPITFTPLTWSQTSSMRHDAAEIIRTIDLVVPPFSYSRNVSNEISGGSSPRQVICSVCLALLLEGEQVRQLPECKHIFHAECIARWLPSHLSCPICRSEVDMTKYLQAAEGSQNFEATETSAPVGS